MVPKMKKEVIAIAFSDLHIDDYTKHNEGYKRTLAHLRVLSIIREQCIKYKCPSLFMGDLLHKPEVLSNNLANILADYLISLDTGDWDMYAISGNHDCSQTNTVEKVSPSWITFFSKFLKFLTPLDLNNGTIIKGKFKAKVFGVPYIDNNVGLTKYLRNLDRSEDIPNILMLHATYPGSKDTNGMEVKSVDKLNTKVLNLFDLVLMGHIHKPQNFGSKVLMVGAPLQQRRTDKNCELGYWKIYSDLTYKFVPISDNFPKFIDVDKPEDKKDDGNYYQVVSSKKKETHQVTTNSITKEISKKTLVRRYMRKKGVKDEVKSKALLTILNEAEDDTI